MPAAVGIHQEGTGRIVAMLVGKYAIEHEKLFAKRVLVRRKNAGGSIANE